MRRDDSGRLWAVVLAAGDGQRLSRLMHALYGEYVPKQFAKIAGNESLLQATVDRIAPLVPPKRTVVVVGVAHEALAREQLAPVKGIDLVLQPRNLDTGPGILLPLARIMARDPSARVAIFPSDHYVPHPEPLLEAVAIAAGACSAAPERVTLLGVAPTAPESDYGWILPGLEVAPDRFPGLRDVMGFVEKPGTELARSLANAGGLWNTFVTVGRARTFWSLAEKHMPEQAQLFAAYAARLAGEGEKQALRDLYERLNPANFSHDVLQHASVLTVLPVEGSGWCDWGSPRRVFQSLQGTPSLEGLIDRLRPVRAARPLVGAGHATAERAAASMIASPARETKTAREATAAASSVRESKTAREATAAASSVREIEPELDQVAVPLAPSVAVP